MDAGVNVNEWYKKHGFEVLIPQLNRNLGPGSLIHNFKKNSKFVIFHKTKALFVS